MLKIRNLYKSFGELQVLKGIDLDIPEGQVVAILGPSGTGKSTLLRCINFLEVPQKGLVEIDGVAVDTENRKEVRALRQKTAMVFQSYNLFANKTCLENVMLPLTAVRGVGKKEAEARARDLMERVGVLEKTDEYPAHLSGGQQQRVGIARALAANPECILFDEPTSSLDPELIGEVLEVIRRLAQEHNRTMLIVTHEMNFAREIADRILFMDEGKIVVDETAERFFGRENSNPRVKKFLEQLTKE